MCAAAPSARPTPAQLTGWLQVACVAAVLDALTRDVSQAGKQTPKARKRFTGTPAWTVVTAA
jgi:hypothetical protein